MRQLVILFLFLTIIITVGCGWHPRNKNTVPSQIKKMIFNSWDPNSSLSRASRNQLRLHNIELVDKDFLRCNIPLFRIHSSSLSKDAVSIFKNGRTAEYQIVLSVNATISIPGKGVYPIGVQVYRSFFDNPQTALAKDVEQQIIINEMYDKAAEQLVHKLLNIKLVPENSSTKHSVPLIAPDISMSSVK